MVHFTVSRERIMSQSGEIWQLRDDTRYVQQFFSDEMLYNTARHEFARQVLESLCRKWLEATGEELTVIEPIEEGTQWRVIPTKDIVLEGEVVEEPDFDRILTGHGGLGACHMGDRHYTDFVIEGEVVEERPAIERGSDG